MKKFVTTIILLLSCVLIFTACKDKGTEIKPTTTISITTAQELQNINKYLGNEYKNYTFELKNDIDLSSDNQWKPIGTQAIPFMGKFVGEGHTITLAVSGMDASGERTAPISASMGIFSHIYRADISDIKVNVSYDYYTEDKFAYVSGLCAYDMGGSNISTVSVSGDIKLGSIFYEKEILDENHEGTGSFIEECQTEQFIGGAVAYSASDSKYSGIVSNVNINNNTYYANNQFEVQSYMGNSNHFPQSSHVGGAFGLVKNSEITDVTSGGNFDIKAKTVVCGGSIASAMGSVLNKITTQTLNLTSFASTKFDLGGLIGFVDSTKVSESRVVESKTYVNSVAQSLAAGNVAIGVGYCYDNSVIDRVTLNGLVEMKFATNSKISIAAIAGAVRESTVINSTVTGNLDMGNYNNANFEQCAVVVSKVFGNSVIDNCSGTVGKKKLTEGYTTLETVVGHIEEISYVNSDGNYMCRFANSEDRGEYVGVYVKPNKDNSSIKLTIFDEANKEIASKEFVVDANMVNNSAELIDAEKYLAVYFNDTDGLKCEIDGRNTAEYKYVSGKPVVSNCTANNID